MVKLRMYYHGLGYNLCPVKVITGHVGLRTRVHSWTRVQILMSPMITFTGHKPFSMDYMHVHQVRVSWQDIIAFNVK